MRAKWFFSWLFLGTNPESLPWAQDAWNAFESGGELRVIPIEPESFGLDPSKTEAAIQFRNEHFIGFYVRTRNSGSSMESLNILVMSPEKRGGIVVCFVDDKPLNWNRPDARGRYPVLPREIFWYTKILEKARTLA